jgi:pimeloyl-ACP methyl ester carboxylesterase
MRVVLIPGWNEAAKYMSTFAYGRHGLDGLNAFGYDCSIFADGHDGIRKRIDHFAAFLDRLRVREPEAFPVATLGYSAGGLISRGFLRAYPERVSEIAATIQVAAPNTGLQTNYAAATLRFARLPTHMLRDMDVESPFMRWLNDVGGHWEVDPDNPRKQRWHLSGKPWVAPAGHRILQIAGRMPKYHLQSDGVVLIESANLDGAMPTTYLDGDEANHLNLGAVDNIFATIFRRFKHDDRVWPRVVALSAKFLRSEPLPETTPIPS